MGNNSYGGSKKEQKGHIKQKFCFHLPFDNPRGPFLSLFNFTNNMLRITCNKLSTGTLARQAFNTTQRSSVVWKKSLTTNTPEPVTIYTGPLANVAKKLKLFSITSLGLGTGISPFVFAIDVPVPFVAKAALVGAGKSREKKFNGSITH